MKAQIKCLAISVRLLMLIPQVRAQGYIVPNGVVYNGLNFFGGYEVDVLRDPANSYSTGFWFTPQTTDTFLFNYFVDVGVQVYFVSPNDPVSLQPILAQNYPRLSGSYTFTPGLPFYVGLYTGADAFAPPNGIYTDPLFGWAELVNNNGVIQLLGGALEYQGGGIIAGTLTIIPEPQTFALLTMAIATMFGLHRRQFRKRALR